MPADEKFEVFKALSGPFNWRNYVKLLVFGICALIIFSVYSTAKEHFFPDKKPATSTTTTGNVEAGGTVQVTNVNNPLPDLKQGIYGELSSKDFGVGVFKEMTPNIDLSLGVEKEFDTDELEFKVQTRFKF
jgi:hypothetical protein